ncbi:MULTISPECIES: bifunctional 2-polyprenyl-6-hydroxyphenol methylase/3-demethylubiquinol 3-O-methyltransferase UbiG [Pseudonocardia]|uniref:Methyltransferase domain-containing protein n=1 Tax=Pseudonocardia oroxyli TaxID=366584 RepID=A0A1G7LXE1_PSEOR|nr:MULTISPECIES: class I SAM-dependent methyltransferase [Pseudonocardia]MCF7551895.1 class I SAM-dependent methyltransferase [Pseudonocardia sp. WMMC193]SDF54113.1 Methyltransferase domain-containing protein [Pseudonocardia oroxyli]
MSSPEGWGAPLYEVVLRGIPEGSTVLDVGCGPGVFAAFAESCGMRVTGLDSSRAALAQAEKTAPTARFVLGDAHQLEGAYDLVALVQVLAHVTNPVKVLQEAARVGGRVRATVWGREEESDIRLFGEALEPFLPPRSQRRTPAGPPPLTEPDRFRKVAGLAGLEVLALDEVRSPFAYPDEDALVGPLLQSDLGRFAANRAGPAAVREAVLATFAPRRVGAGYRLENLFRVMDAVPARAR